MDSLQKQRTTFFESVSILQIDNSGQNELQDIVEKSFINTLKRQNLITLLATKQPVNRTQKDCRQIAEYLKQEPYFAVLSKNNNKTLLQISSWIQYRLVKQNDFIYQIHDSSDCFYVIIKGQVHLTCPNKEDDIEIESTEEHSHNNLKVSLHSSIYPTAPPMIVRGASVHYQNSGSQKSHSSGRLHRMNTIGQPQTTPHRSHRLTSIVQVVPTPVKKKVLQDRIVRTVNCGECFGDLGDSSRRVTNAISKDITHLLVIKKHNYGIISHAQLKSGNKIKYEFLAALPIFKSLNRYTLQEFIYFLQQIKVCYNNIVYNEDSYIKYVYIIFKGQFKLYKKVNSRKEIQMASQYKQIKEKRVNQRNITFKTIQCGQILGYIQAYKKERNYKETCVCKSQEGVIFRIERAKFLKMVLSSDNNMQEMLKFLQQKSQIKLKELEEFIKQQQNNCLLVRYLHTPSAKNRRTYTDSSIQKEKKENKEKLRRLSTSQDNFFNQMNKTVRQKAKLSRISINRSLKIDSSIKDRAVPSSIRDIVQMVDHQCNYHEIRKPKKEVMLFQFNITKVPLHIKKKYDMLFKKTKK